MKKRILILISLMVLLCMGTIACKKNVPEEPDDQTVDVYSGTLLLNGFDTIADMYKVRQHTYVKNGKWTGYSAKGKLTIVDKDDFLFAAREYEGEDVHKAEDMAPRQGEGALYINYVTENLNMGHFTQLIARFANSDFADLPVGKLGGVSVEVYSDNADERTVTLSLVKSDMSLMSLGDDGTVTLAPYSWTTCSLDLNPAIVEHFQDDIIGLAIEFSKKIDSVYYVDDLCLSFEQVYTDEIKENVATAEALAKDIENETLETRETLETLYKRYLDLPEEYRVFVTNYDSLETAINNYLSNAYQQELAQTGEGTLLRFNEFLGLTQITGGTGYKVSYTTEEHAPSEEGAICVEFDGSMNWVTLFVNPCGIAYDEVRVWVKNDSEFARVLQLNWNTLLATGGSAYDENGQEITNALTDVDYRDNIIAKGGWIELVWRKQINPAFFVTTSYDTSQTKNVKSEGKLYIGAVRTGVTCAGMIARIDALEEKDRYTDEELL